MKDMALKVLLSTGKRLAPDLPEELLQKTYEIQVNHQFDKDRSTSLGEMSRLVEEFLDNGIDQRKRS